MKKIIITVYYYKICFASFASIIFFTCCTNNNKNETLVEATSVEGHAPVSVDNVLVALKSDEFVEYQGVQPSYFMKNQYGDDMVINGKKVSVPSINYKFLIKENAVVSLQQINLEDNSRVYYDGTYKIISQENNTIIIECSLSDGQGSNPTYVLTLNKSDKKGICTGNNEPVFSIEKNKTHQNENF